MRQFVEKCLATVSVRLPAKELLKDPFLQINEFESDKYPFEEFGEVGSLVRLPYHGNHHNDGSLVNCCSPYYLDDAQSESERGYHVVEFEGDEINLCTYQEDEHLGDIGITIKGRREDDGIFLRLRIADREGQIFRFLAASSWISYF